MSEGTLQSKLTADAFLHAGLAEAYQSTDARIADQSSQDAEVSAKSSFLCRVPNFWRLCVVDIVLRLQKLAGGMFILVPVPFSKHLSPTLPDFILIWQSLARQTETDARPNNVRMSGRAKTHKTFDTPCFVSAVPSCRGKIARCLFSSLQVVINKFEKPLPVQPMRFRESRSMEQCYRIAPRLQFCPYSRRKRK